jgi:hypothetical protein
LATRFNAELATVGSKIEKASSEVYRGQYHEQEARVSGNLAEKAGVAAGLKVDTDVQPPRTNSAEATDKTATATEQERRLLDATESKWKERFPTKPLPAEFNRDYHACMEAAMNGIIADDVNLKAADLAAMENLSKAYGADEGKPSGEAKTVNRLLEIAVGDGKATMATDMDYAGRTLDLRYDPVRVRAQDLVELGSQSRIELTRTGIQQTRDKAVGELLAGRDLTKDEVVKLLKEYIKDVEDDFGKRGTKVTEEERIRLRDLKRATENLEHHAAMPEHLKSALRSTRKGIGEAGGAAIGLGIIASAALGWYIMYKAGNTKMEAAPPLEFGR